MGQKADVFSMDIEGEGVSRLIRNGTQMTLIPSGSIYRIRLRNASNCRCDVVVACDEYDIGEWRLEPREIFTLEEYPHTGIKFKMLRGGEVIRAIFIPKKAWIDPDQRGSVCRDGSMNVDWSKVEEVSTKLILI